jgi:hypothetical protein
MPVMGQVEGVQPPFHKGAGNLDATATQAHVDP